MLKVLSFVTFVVVSGSADAEPSLPTESELRNLARVGDIEALEDTYKNVHALNIAGEITADQLRETVSALIVTDPYVIRTLENWLEAKPASPYAATAVARTYEYLGWDIRGSKFAGQTYPQALSDFQQMHEYAMELAVESYEAAPDYIAASDAVMALQLTTKALDIDYVDELVRDVMLAQPNFGTLERAAKLENTNWGGRGFSFIATNCHLFLGGVSNYGGLTELEGFDALSCVSALALRLGYRGDALHAALRDASMFEESTPNDIRLLAMVKSGNRKYRKEIEEYVLSDEGDIYLQILLTDLLYENFHLTRDEYDELRRHFPDRIMLWAPDQLKQDPFNKALLELVSGRRTQDFRNPVFWVTPEKLRMIDARILMSSPYDVDAWRFLAGAHLSSPMEEERELGRLMLGNAVLFSNYDPLLIQEAVLGAENHITYFKLQQIAEFDSEVDPEALAAALPTLICPAVRADRLQSLICGQKPENAESPWHDQHCDQVHNPLSQRVSILSQARKAGICGFERSANWSWLAYRPQDIDLEPLIDFDMPDER
ncbi:MAG: hypothetical protein AAFQ64_17115 [Pseudomonadota bacterium]